MSKPHCSTCYWRLFFKREWEKTWPHEELPRLEYCSHPRHTGDLILPTCPDYFKAVSGDVPVRNVRKVLKDGKWKYERITT